MDDIEESAGSWHQSHVSRRYHSFVNALEPEQDPRVGNSVAGLFVCSKTKTATSPAHEP